MVKKIHKKTCITCKRLMALVINKNQINLLAYLVEKKREQNKSQHIAPISLPLRQMYLVPCASNKCHVSQKWLVVSVWVAPLSCNFSSINSAAQSDLYSLLQHLVIWLTATYIILSSTHQHPYHILLEVKKKHYSFRL